MADRQKPAYWAVLPAKVRYDKDLRPNAKLLYAEISALADLTGYCWASNDTLGQLYGLSKKTVSDLVSSLTAKGYIEVEILRDEKGEITERRIHVDKPMLFSPPDETHPPIPKNKDTPHPENEVTPIPKNKDNNNIININNTPIAPKGGRREIKKEPDYKPERFKVFWKMYPRGENKQAAIRAWDKLQPDEVTMMDMQEGLNRQIKSPEWQRGIGIPYAATWLNNRRWEDEDRNRPAAQTVSSSWEDDEEVRYD